MILWVVGQAVLVDDGNGDLYDSWEFGGMFTTEAKAVAACKTPAYWYGPCEIDKELPEEGIPWPGAVCPMEGTALDLEWKAAREKRDAESSETVPRGAS